MKFGSKNDEPNLFGYNRTQRKVAQWVLKDRSSVQRYTIALLVLFVSIALTWLINYLIPHSDLFSINLASSIIAAAFGGLVPGILVGLLEAVVVDLILIEPLGTVLDSWTSLIRIFLYVGFAWLTSLLVSTLREVFYLSERARVVAENELRAREGVLAIVSHDLRNPLSSIGMNLSLLQRIFQGVSDSRVVRPMDSMQRSLQRMNRQIEDLLDAVKVERGTFSISAKDQPIGRLIEDSLEAIEESAKEKNIQLRVEVPDEVPSVHFDFGRVYQVLSNLLGNAVKFSPAGSKVALIVTDRPTSVEFLIKDSGPGVPRGEIDKLFQRFWQRKDTAHQGTGLGLFISKAIVDAHAGRIGLRNPDVPGAEFYFTIPKSGIEKRATA